MTYSGRCARCNQWCSNKAFASCPDGKSIPDYATAAHVPHRSDKNDKVCPACSRKISRSRPARPPLIDLTLSHAEKLQTGENMRRLLKHEGDDDCVILPSPRGPSTTWCKLTTPRVDNNDCSGETRRRRAKTMESIRERLSAVSDNSNKENQDSVQRLRVAEVKRQPDLRATGMEKSHCQRRYIRICWSTTRDWARFH